MRKPTLVLDLDGTLIRNDLTFDLLVMCARWKPLIFLVVLFKSLVSRADAKHLLAVHFLDKIDPDAQPYEPGVLSLANRFKRDGHHVELVSGSDEQLVKVFAEHNDIAFHKGSTVGVNLTAARKAKFLSERHGNNYIYVGNSKSDFPVWRAGQGGYAVNAPAQAYRLKRPDHSAVKVKELVAPRSQLASLMQSLRAHQWAKNLLLLIVPAIQFVNLNLNDWILLFWAVLDFSVLASATYLINDLLDLQDDRQHRLKRHRPLASGHLRVPVAATFIAAMIPISLLGAFLINPMFGWVALSYLVLTLLYSLVLKRLAVFDVFTLAGLFSIRVIAGAYIVGFPPSGWLLTFVGCFFLSLAIAKRFIELISLDGKNAVSGRGYVAGDEGPLLAAGCAIGILAVLAMLIYGLSAPVTVFNSETVVLVGSGLLLAWVFRFWLLAARRKISEDPVLFAIRDRTSLSLLFVISSIFAFDLTSPIWLNLS